MDESVNSELHERITDVNYVDASSLLMRSVDDAFHEQWTDASFMRAKSKKYQNLLKVVDDFIALEHQNSL
ncbi:hypothetical protein T05_9297 [Trichinella murrelli]|uniref:Uncharacterized protein n=1 Tax=Trichinella murrelli TaxID=144512 RepID=A0A0V0TU06_9BILA|nr:hypothetical protein T05_9297 [Trichinella murrelli]